ncbi:hypothetical protein [Tenacibaculum sp.]
MVEKYVDDSVFDFIYTRAIQKWMPKLNMLKIDDQDCIHIKE